MKKRSIFSVLIGMVAGLFCAFSANVTIAKAQDSEYVKIDFSNSSAYTYEGTVVALEEGASLGASTKVSTTETFTSFLMYLDVRSIAGDCAEVFFGENAVRLYANGDVYSKMQKSDEGRAFTFDELSAGGVIMLQYIGGNVSVGIAGSDQPTSLLETPVASYAIENPTTPFTVGVATDERTVLNLASIRVYTLAPTVDILPDHWESGDEGRPDKKPPVVEQTDGCGSAVSGVATALGATALCCVAVIFKKKER